MSAPDHAAIARAAGAESLEILGGFHPRAQEGAPEGTGTLLLLGPAEPGFWSHVTAAPEFRDGGADPLDRWSRRVIGALARRFDAAALYPFDGPPWSPFQSWALRTGRAWTSPVRLLVHETAGLLVSFRGALALGPRLALPDSPPAAPCAACPDRPCLSACPVDALGAEGYDVPACRGFLDTPNGRDCLGRGCAVRRACPVSRLYRRDPAQSAYHMSRFHQP